MPISGASVAVAAGAVSAVLGTIWPSILPSWGTEIYVTDASTGTVGFTVPAPGGGGTLYYFAGTASAGSGTTTLSDYQAELRLLLRDENDDYSSPANKTAWINRAIKRRDIDSGQNRALITYTLVSGTALYNFTTIGNASVFDVVGVALIDGNQRIQLNRYSYTELSVLARQWTGYQTRPLAFCRYAPNQVYLAPTPGSAYSSEWDCSVFSPSLVNAGDTDPLVYPYTAPVPYYAAYLAKLYERQQDEAAYFLALYKEHLDVALNSRVGYSPSQYSGYVRV